MEGQQFHRYVNIAAYNSELLVVSKLSVQVRRIETIPSSFKLSHTDCVGMPLFSLAVCSLCAAVLSLCCGLHVCMHRQHQYTTFKTSGYGLLSTTET